MKTRQNLFICPGCGYNDKEFHYVCPGCGRPFVRDFIDTRVHPRDPNPAGIYSGTFRARIFQECILPGRSLCLLTSFGSISELLSYRRRYTSNIKKHVTHYYQRI